MFVTKRTLKKNNDILFKRNTELNKICIHLQQGIHELKDKNKDLEAKNRDLENELIVTSEFLDDKKKECKRLKTILTKNGITYRKEN